MVNIKTKHISKNKIPLYTTVIMDDQRHQTKLKQINQGSIFFQNEFFSFWYTNTFFF